MKFERRINGGPWLPIVGTWNVAWIKGARLDLYERMLRGETITDPLSYPGAQYRLRLKQGVGE